MSTRKQETHEQQQQDQEALVRLLEDPRVPAVLAARRVRAVTLTAVVSAVYLAVAIGCAFAPALMRTRLVGGISLGIAAMVLIMVVGIGCSGYYTWWANAVRDPQVRDILRTHADRQPRPPRPRETSK